jgi:type IV fimbrial biogenesis protein FimT
VGTNSKGFSLFELMIIISILGLTMAIAAPNLASMISNNRISVSANDFVAALQLAKAETASRVNPVTICKKNAAGKDCVTSGDWSQGWIVFSDTDGDASVDSDEMVLLNHEPLNSKISFGGTGDAKDFITYRPSGTTTIREIEFLTVCDDRGISDDAAKGILVTITGRGNVIKASETGQPSCL